MYSIRFAGPKGKGAGWKQIREVGRFRQATLRASGLCIIDVAYVPSMLDLRESGGGGGARRSRSSSSFEGQRRGAKDREV